MAEEAARPTQAAIRTDLGAIFVSLELSRSTWLITSLSPGGGEKMSKHSVPAGDARSSEFAKANGDMVVHRCGASQFSHLSPQISLTQRSWEEDGYQEKSRPPSW